MLRYMHPLLDPRLPTKRTEMILSMSRYKQVEPSQYSEGEERDDTCMIKYLHNNNFFSNRHIVYVSVAITYIYKVHARPAARA